MVVISKEYYQNSVQEKNCIVLFFATKEIQFVVQMKRSWFKIKIQNQNCHSPSEKLYITNRPSFSHFLRMYHRSSYPPEISLDIYLTPQTYYTINIGSRDRQWT